MTKCIWILLLSTAFFGCASTQPQNGPIQTVYPDGQVKEDLYYKNGELDGICRAFYPDGTFKSIKIYRDGRLNGICREYREDGTLKSATNYFNDQKDGFHNIYYPNDSVWLNTIYSDGQVIERKEYNQEGFTKEN